MCQLLATICVASSLALVALGGSDPIDGFRIGTLSFGRPLDNRGAYFRYNCCIPRCRGWRVEPYRFASSVVTSWGIKLAVAPTCNLRPFA
jgi:hypothetical protein